MGVGEGGIPTTDTKVCALNILSTEMHAKSSLHYHTYGSIIRTVVGMDRMLTHMNKCYLAYNF